MKHDLRLVYYIAFTGDLTLSLLVVLTILYGTGMGLSTIQIGLIGAAYGFAYIVMPAVSGRISDKISRKISLLIASLGQMVLTLFFLFIIFQSSKFLFYGLFLGLFLCGIIYSFFWPSIEAYVSEHTKFSSKEHEKGIANFCISWSIGYALGPLFGGFFYDFNIILAFVIAFILYFSSFILILLKLPLIKPKNNILITKNVHEVKELNKLNNQKHHNPHSNKITFLLLTGVLTYAIISKVLLSYFTNYAALPQGLNWTGTLIGQVMFFFGLGRTFYFFIAHYLKNSFAVLTQSFLIIGICLITLPLFYSPFLIAPILFIIGFCVGRTYYVSLDLLLKHEQEKKGAKAGIFESMVGLGSSLSPLFAGMIATINLKTPYYIFAIVVFGFIIIHLILKKNPRIEENNKKS